MSDDLTALWERHWEHCLPVADWLKHIYRDRWVRFHSLPGSKRYPGNEAEYDIVLGRYNTVLDELFHGEEVRVVTVTWSAEPHPEPLTAQHAGWHPDARYWRSVFTNEGEETDPEFFSYAHLHVSTVVWRPGRQDALLRAVADDLTGGVMITSLSFDRIHHPYDGGAAVLLPTGAARDELKQRHADWLSADPNGF